VFALIGEQALAILHRRVSFQRPSYQAAENLLSQVFQQPAKEDCWMLRCWLKGVTHADACAVGDNNRRLLRWNPLLRAL
jgi:hypothetical protein